MTGGPGQGDPRGLAATGLAIAADASRASPLAHVEAVFHEVVDLPVEVQSTRLGELCGENVALRAAVQRLIAQDRSPGQLAEVVARASHAALATTALVGRRIGAYRVVREVGRGGMGVVYEARRDDDAYDQRVALKVAALGIYAPEFARRFAIERRILAQLEHPHIARLFDGGTTDDGVPYLVMEYVDGLPLPEHATRNALSVPDRLRLFLQACGAVDYAHQRLVIHRDLKASHIVVAGGSVRLLDFGVATLIDPTGEGRTSTGATPLTPDYCSPEQVRGEPVTTRTDVYALGLVLYELLTGERGQRADTTSAVTLERSICDTPLVPPGECAKRSGNRALARQLAGDLDTIVLKAAHKDPIRRYASAAALADDLQRHLEARPILARADSRWYRARRFARRRWAPLTAAALVLVTAAAGVAATVAQARRAERRFAQVRSIANTLMTDVHTAIRDLPASTAAQEVVVRTAVNYLDGLAAEAAGDRGLLLEIAGGYVRVARLAYSLSRPSLSRPDDAAAYYAKANTIITNLERQAPDGTAVLVARVRLDTARGQFLDERGQKAEALAMLEQAVAVAERGVSIAPADRDALDALAEVLAELVSSFEDSPTAQARVARYLEIEERRSAAGSPTAARLHDLGMAYVQAGKVESAASDDANGTVHYRQGIEQYERALALEPANATIRRDLMLVWNHLSEQSLGDRGTASYSGSGARFSPLPPADQAAAEEAARATVEHATWLYERDPSNPTVAMDFAIAVGRSAPAFPIGSGEAIRLLDRSLQTLQGLAGEHGGGTAYFLIEFHGSRAERQRQRGEIALAIRDWEAVRRALHAQRESDASAYRPQRQVIPMFENWATTLAEQGDRRGALALAAEVVRLADAVATRQDVYARALGWPPRVRGWLAGFHDALGESAAAAQARAEAARLWTAVAARTDLPADLVAEARAALSGAPAR